MSSECANIIISVASVFVAIVTLIATVVIGNEQRRNAMIYADATKFILKYSSPKYDAEIYLLPLCVIAYKYDSIYPYRREMYREFCSLTEETQNCILKRQRIDIKSSKYDNFYDDMLTTLKSDIERNYPNDRDLYYNNGKYFERALRHHGNKKVINIKCNVDEYYTDSLSAMLNNSDKSVIDYEDHITNLLAYKKNDNPIKRLMSEKTSIGTPTNDGEFLISYLSCIVAKYVSCYSHSYDDCKYENVGGIDDFQGTKYIEDLFLDALLNIYKYQ